MKTEDFLRIAMIILLAAGIILAVISLIFSFSVPALLPLIAAAVFILFSILTHLTEKRSELKHAKFMIIFSLFLALMNIVIGAVQIIAVL